MSFASTAPAVIPALIAAWTTALPGTTIRDANPVSGSAELEAITVGWNPDVTEPAITGAFSAVNTQFLGSPLEEQYSIRSAIVVLNGNSDIVAARTRAFQLLAGVGGAIVPDITLGSVVMRASLGAWELMPYKQDSSGATATIAFDVDIYAFTTV